MRTTVLLLLLVVANVWESSPVSAQIWFAIDAPAPSAIVRQTLTIQVSSMGAITHGEATVGSTTTQLTRTSGGFTGVLTLTGQTAGDKTLTVTLYDGADVPLVRTVSFVYQPLLAPPIVLEPTAGQLVQDRSVRVRATCANTMDTSCTLSTATSSSTGPSLDTVLLVPTSFAGTKYTVSVTARDGTGQAATTNVLVYLAWSDPLLEPVITSTEGNVIDFDGERALALSDAKTRAWIVPRSGAATSIYDGPDVVERGDVSAHGAVVAMNMRASNRKAFIWTGALRAGDIADARIKGNLLAFVERLPRPTVPPALPSYVENLVLEDLSTGQRVWSTGYSINSATNWIVDIGLSADGSVIWRDENQNLIHWRTNDAVVTKSRSNPLHAPSTDGLRAIYTSANNSLNEILLLKPDGNTDVLCASVPQLDGYCPDAALSGGFIAYRSLSADRTLWRTFRRTPSDGIEQITSPSDIRAIADVTPAGEVLVQTASGRHALAQTPAASTQFPDARGGRFVHRSGAWYLLVDRSVLRVRLPGEGSIDGGTSSPTDAGGSGEPQGGTDASDQPDAAAPGGIPGHDAATPGYDSGALDDGGPSAQGDASSPETDDARDGCTLAPRALPQAAWTLLLTALFLGRRRCPRARR